MPDGAELTFGHDLVGRETQRQCDAFALRQEYDAMGQLTRAHSGQLQQGHLLAGLAREYRYDRAGNLIGERHGREAQGYRLDGCGRVLESLSYRPDTGLRQEAQFSYTRQGLPLGDADATYWQQGRVCQRGDTLYDYDKAGRLISKRQLRAGFRPEQWHYRWDNRNQLCAVTTPNGTTWQYRYDPFGRRISKRCEQTGEEVCYLWDGDQTAEVRHLQRGQLLARRHWVWRGWELLVQQRLTVNAQANTSTAYREQGLQAAAEPWQTDFAISKQMARSSVSITNRASCTGRRQKPRCGAICAIAITPVASTLVWGLLANCVTMRADFVITIFVITTHKRPVISPPTR